MSEIIEAQPVAVRAGLWRRIFAFAIDSIVIAVLFQLTVAGLFYATSGQIQAYGDLNSTTCSLRQTVPAGLTPPPPVGADFVRECDVGIFGAQTAKILQVGRATPDETNSKLESRTYTLARDGRPIDGLMVDWIGVMVLIAYLIGMVTLTGSTLGSRAMQIHVVDTSAPNGSGVRLRKVVMRYAAMLIGFLPFLAVLFVYFGWQGSVDEFHALVGKLTSRESFLDGFGRWALHWRPMLGEYLFDLPGILRRDGALSAGPFTWLFDIASLVLTGWAIVLIVQIVRRRDPYYDRIAGTAVAIELPLPKRSDMSDA